jgi:excinuclease UvrABC helicase subunit UvrB
MQPLFVAERPHRQARVIALVPNNTLAAQLYGEMND